MTSKLFFRILGIVLLLVAVLYYFLWYNADFKNILEEEIAKESYLVRLNDQSLLDTFSFQNLDNVKNLKNGDPNYFIISPNNRLSKNRWNPFYTAKPLKDVVYSMYLEKAEMDLIDNLDEYLDNLNKLLKIQSRLFYLGFEIRVDALIALECNEHVTLDNSNDSAIYEKIHPCGVNINKNFIVASNIHAFVNTDAKASGVSRRDNVNDIHYIFLSRHLRHNEVFLFHELIHDLSLNYVDHFDIEKKYACGYNVLDKSDVGCFLNLDVRDLLVLSEHVKKRDNLSSDDNLSVPFISSSCICKSEESYLDQILSSFELDISSISTSLFNEVEVLNTILKILKSDLDPKLKFNTNVIIENDAMKAYPTTNELMKAYLGDDLLRYIKYRKQGHKELRKSNLESLLMLFSNDEDKYFQDLKTLAGNYKKVKGINDKNLFVDGEISINGKVKSVNSRLSDGSLTISAGHELRMDGMQLKLFHNNKFIKKIDFKFIAKNKIRLEGKDELPKNDWNVDIPFPTDTVDNDSFPGEPLKYTLLFTGEFEILQNSTSNITSVGTNTYKINDFSKPVSFKYSIGECGPFIYTKSPSTIKFSEENGYFTFTDNLIDKTKKKYCVVIRNGGSSITSIVIGGKQYNEKSEICFDNSTKRKFEIKYKSNLKFRGGSKNGSVLNYSSISCSKSESVITIVPTPKKSDKYLIRFDKRISSIVLDKKLCRRIDDNSFEVNKLPLNIPIRYRFDKCELSNDVLKLNVNDFKKVSGSNYLEKNIKLIDKSAKKYCMNINPNGVTIISVLIDGNEHYNNKNTICFDSPKSRGYGIKYSGNSKFKKGSLFGNVKNYTPINCSLHELNIVIKPVLKEVEKKYYIIFEGTSNPIRLTNSNATKISNNKYLVSQFPYVSTVEYSMEGCSNSKIGIQISKENFKLSKPNEYSTIVNLVDKSPKRYCVTVSNPRNEKYTIFWKEKEVDPKDLCFDKPQNLELKILKSNKLPTKGQYVSINRRGFISSSGCNQVNAVLDLTLIR